jgi:homoserine kinase
MEPCNCNKRHEWGIGTTVSGDGPVILWNLVSFHSEETARAYADKLNKEKAESRASYFIVDMFLKGKETVTA